MTGKIYATFIYTDWIPTPWRMQIWHYIQNERDEIVRMKMHLYNIPQFPMDEKTFLDNKTLLDQISKEIAPLCIILQFEKNRLFILHQGDYYRFNSREDAYKAIYKNARW